MNKAVLLLLLGILMSCSSAPASALPAATPTPQPMVRLIKRPTTTAKRSLFELAERIHQVSITAHPTQVWAAVGIVHRYQLTDEPLAAYVRGQDAESGLWNEPVQLDTGATRMGYRTGGVALAVPSDGTLLAFWGGSASDGGLWLQQSRDQGQTWQPRERIAGPVSAVLGAATSSDGWVAVLATGYRRQSNGTADLLTTVVLREPSGRWLPAQSFPMPAYFGAIVLSGSGSATRVTALIGTKQTNSILLLNRQVTGSEAWRQQTITQANSGVTDPQAYYRQMQGLSFETTTATGEMQTEAAFVWTRRDAAEVFVVRSQNGGQQWSQIERVVQRTGLIENAALVYDPLGRRLAVVYACCGAAGKREPAAHYVAWSSNIGEWHTEKAPLVLGERSADHTVLAQNQGSQQIWLAWIEEGQRVEIRQLDLGNLLPPTGEVSHVNSN
jgi:hypothetical protein